jgi:hypothetical protein
MLELSNDTLRRRGGEYKPSFINLILMLLLLLVDIEGSSLKDALSYLVDTVTCLTCQPIAGVIQH